MAVYELIIEQRQPTCGGKSPTQCEILTVTTNDPVAYVKAREAGRECEVSATLDGSIVVKLVRNNFWVKYTFTED